MKKINIFPKKINKKINKLQNLKMIINFRFQIIRSLSQIAKSHY